MSRMQSMTDVLLKGVIHFGTILFCNGTMLAKF